MSRTQFHIHLYGPAGVDSTKPRPIPTSFEAACDRLAQSLPAVLVEPDGSIAWASPTHQIVGMIYDHASQIQYIELRGHSTRDQLKTLVRILAGAEHVLAGAEHVEDAEIASFAVIELPEGQWNNFQSFANSLPE